MGEPDLSVETAWAGGRRLCTAGWGGIGTALAVIVGSYYGGVWGGLLGGAIGGAVGLGVAYLGCCVAALRQQRDACRGEPEELPPLAVLQQRQTALIALEKEGWSLRQQLSNQGLWNVRPVSQRALDYCEDSRLAFKSAGLPETAKPLAVRVNALRALVASPPPAKDDAKNEREAALAAVVATHDAVCFVRVRVEGMIEESDEEPDENA